MTDRTDLENRIRASLEARANDVAPTPQLWQDVERKVSRRNRWQVGLWALGSAAAVVIAVLVVPMFLGTGGGLRISNEPAGTPDGPAVAGSVDRVITTDGQTLFEVDAATGEVIRERTPYAPSSELEGYQIGSVAVRPGSGNLTVAATRLVEGEWDVTVYVFDGSNGDYATPYNVAMAAPPDVTTPPTVTWSQDGRYLAWVETTANPDNSLVEALDWQAYLQDSATPASQLGPIDAAGPAGEIRIQDWTGSPAAQSSIWLSALGGNVTRLPVEPGAGGALVAGAAEPFAYEGGAPIDVAHLGDGTTVMLVAQSSTTQDAEGATLHLLLDPMSDTQRELPLPDGFPNSGTASPGDAWLSADGDTLTVGFGPQGWVMRLSGDTVETRAVESSFALPDGTVAADVATRVGSAPAPDPTSGPSGDVTLERSLVTTTPGGREVEVETFRVTGGVDAAVADRVNGDVQSIVDGILSDFDVQANEAEQGNPNPNPMGLNATLTVDRADARVLSVAWQVGEYFGGANANGRWQVATWDLTTGDRLGFDDLFAAGARSALIDPVAATIDDQYGLGADASSAQQLTTDPSLLDQITLTDTGVAFHFDQYAVAPGAAGAVRAIVPLTDVSQQLSATAVALLSEALGPNATSSPDGSAAPADGLPTHVVRQGGGGFSLVARADPETPVAAWTRPDGVPTDLTFVSATVHPASNNDDVGVLTRWARGETDVYAWTRVTRGQVVANAALPDRLQPNSAGLGPAADVAPSFDPTGRYLAWLEATDTGWQVRILGWTLDGATGTDTTVPVTADRQPAALRDISWADPTTDTVVLTMSTAQDPDTGIPSGYVQTRADLVDGTADPATASTQTVDTPLVLVAAGSVRYEDGDSRYAVWGTEGGMRYSVLDAPQTSVDVPTGGAEVLAFGPDQVVVRMSDGTTQVVHLPDGVHQEVTLPSGTVALLPSTTSPSIAGR